MITRQQENFALLAAWCRRHGHPITDGNDTQQLFNALFEVVRDRGLPETPENITEVFKEAYQWRERILANQLRGERRSEAGNV